jgi:predicted enzyme related to lactoylglutathione lyase
MTTRDTAFAPGTPCWVDLLSSDTDKSKAFYAGILGWQPLDTSAEFGGYVNFVSDGHPVAGMVANRPEIGSPDVWTTYISTADIEATVAAAADAGAQVMAPVMKVGDIGSMAVLIDPAGAAFGVWQPGQHLGFTKYNEPGSVTWDEHHSKDFPATVDFYAKVFGWHIDKMADTDEFRYYQGQIDGETVVGLMDSKGFLPDEVPSHWAVYFSVADVDEAVAKAVELGGSVLRPAEDTEFGRIADLLDVTGAAFKLHSTKLVNPPASS